MLNYEDPTNHWFKQRFSAATIIFFIVLPFLISLNINKYYLSFKDFDSILVLLSVNLICIYHGYLGFEVVLEDYVKDMITRRRLMLTLNFFSWSSIIVSILLIIYIFIIHLDFGIRNPNFLKFFISTLSIITFLYLLLGKRNFLYFILIAPLLISLGMIGKKSIDGLFIISGVSLTLFFKALYSLQSDIANKKPDSILILFINLISLCVILCTLCFMFFLLIAAGMTSGMSIVSFFIGILEIFVFIYIAFKQLISG